MSSMQFCSQLLKMTLSDGNSYIWPTQYFGSEALFDNADDQKYIPCYNEPDLYLLSNMYSLEELLN